MIVEQLVNKFKKHNFSSKECKFFAYIWDKNDFSITEIKESEVEKFYLDGREVSYGYYDNWDCKWVSSCAENNYLYYTSSLACFNYYEKVKNYKLENYKMVAKND